MEKENDKISKENLMPELDSSEDKQVHSEEIDEPTLEEEAAEPTLEEKIKEMQDKLLRALASSENQRRRSEKETKEAFEYGGFNFARETLSLLDNLQRAHQSIKNDESLKENKDLNKFCFSIYFFFIFIFIFY